MCPKPLNAVCLRGDTRPQLGLWGRGCGPPTPAPPCIGLTQTGTRRGPTPWPAPQCHVPPTPHKPHQPPAAPPSKAGLGCVG